MENEGCSQVWFSAKAATDPKNIEVSKRSNSGRSRRQAVWVYDLPRNRHGNQGVRRLPRKLGMLLCKLTSYSMV